MRTPPEPFLSSVQLSQLFFILEMLQSLNDLWGLSFHSVQCIHFSLILRNPELDAVLHIWLQWFHLSVATCPQFNSLSKRILRILQEKVLKALLKSRKTISSGVPSSSRQAILSQKVIKWVKHDFPFGETMLSSPEDFLVSSCTWNWFPLLPTPSLPQGLRWGQFLGFLTSRRQEWYLHLLISTINQRFLRVVSKWCLPAPSALMWAHH